MQAGSKPGLPFPLGGATSFLPAHNSMAWLMLYESCGHEHMPGCLQRTVAHKRVWCLDAHKDSGMRACVISGCQGQRHPRACV